MKRTWLTGYEMLLKINIEEWGYSDEYWVALRRYLAFIGRIEPLIVEGVK